MQAAAVAASDVACVQTSATVRSSRSKHAAHACCAAVLRRRRPRQSAAAAHHAACVLGVAEKKRQHCLEGQQAKADEARPHVRTAAWQRVRHAQAAPCVICALAGGRAPTPRARRIVSSSKTHHTHLSKMGLSCMMRLIMPPVAPSAKKMNLHVNVECVSRGRGAARRRQLVSEGVRAT